MALTINDLVPFVAVGAAAVTALSTIAGVRLANRAAEMQLQLRLTHQDTKDQEEALRFRLEELYQLVSTWAGEVVLYYITFRKVMDGELTYNQALDVTNGKNNLDAARLFTLAELYFPISHDALSDIKSDRDELAKTLNLYKNKYKEFGPEADDENFAKLLTAKLLEFNSAVDRYQESLARHVREM